MAQSRKFALKMSKSLCSTLGEDQKHDVRFTRFHVDEANNNLIAVFNLGLPV